MQGIQPILDSLLVQWQNTFPSTPEVIVRAPGRVNIIGEHTDYNEGWVMPGAMSRSLYLLVSRAGPLPPNSLGRGDNSPKHHWIAADLNEELRFDHEEDIPRTRSIWAKYILGAIHVYENDLGPLHIMIGGDLPIGAGVSSSSSLVGGLLLALQALTGDQKTPKDLAQLSSRVEREIIGLQGGIMDQFAIMLSEKDKVMMLDCRDQTFEFISASIPGTQWVLINTKVKHQLIDSDYNQRAAQCKQAVQIIQNTFPEVKSLRDVDEHILIHSKLPETLYQRSSFVVKENHRVHEMKLALEMRDAARAGQLLQASHLGLQHEYEVSCAELDHLAM
ncbi:MAG TPA: galactokinase family protein, partial [Saprospiraceae bacterium]|nr:galactokinase family protein [Saprospiraceae bacterium]